MVKRKATTRRFSPKAERMLRSLRGVRWSKDGQVRCAKGWCPLLKLVARRRMRDGLQNYNYEQAGELLGLTQRESWVIADAADNRSALLHARLLMLLGIPKDDAVPA